MWQLSVPPADKVSVLPIAFGGLQDRIILGTVTVMTQRYITQELEVTK